jgi:6-phosphogluconolactonase
MTQTVQREVRILPDAAAIAKRSADEFIRAANAAVEARGAFTVALAGGSTPKAMYALLAENPTLRAQVPWDKLRIFFGDERHVPPDHKDSNYNMAREAMFSKVALKPEQIHRIKGEEAETEKAALEYEQVLRAYFQLKDGQLPRLDLILLGMGEEGHTLSLFPGTKALRAPANRLVVRNWVGKLYTERITLTSPVANQARQVIFAVTKADKALALKAVLEGPYEPEQLPSQLIQPESGKLLWLVDPDAGSKLSVGIRE